HNLNRLGHLHLLTILCSKEAVRISIGCRWRGTRLGDHSHKGALAEGKTIAFGLSGGYLHDVAGGQVKECLVVGRAMFLLQSEAQSSFGTTTHVATTAFSKKWLGDNPKDAT